MIELVQISKAYGEKAVISDFSLTLPDRGILALTGKNGSGKTTLLRLLAGLEEPDAGQIRMPVQTRVSYVFQDYRLLPSLTVRQNLLLVLEKSRRQEADTWLQAVGLAAYADALPASLSGGMRQRTALARALAYGGELLLLDEPFAALDTTWKPRMMDEVLRAAETGCVLLTTHDPSDLSRLGCSVVSLSDSGG